MSMKQFAIVPVYGLKRAAGFVEDIPILPSMILIRSGKQWLSLTDTHFKEAIGRLECQWLEKSESAIWCPIDPDEVLLDSKGYLFDHLRIVRLFLNMLWAVKDCSVNVKLGFLQWHRDSMTGYESNALGCLYDKASGEMSDTVFSKTEIQRALSLMHAFATIRRYKRDQRTAVLDGNSRVALSLHHLEAGRRAMDPALRIMHGCSALESLLSTSKGELAHQLSERVALLVGSTPDHRRKIFSEMKAVYDIRSTVTHGAGLKDGRIKILPETSSKFDSLLRTVFCSILENATFNVSSTPEPPRRSTNTLSLVSFSGRKQRDHYNL
jgi:hypothetical protein